MTNWRDRFGSLKDYGMNFDEVTKEHRHLVLRGDELIKYYQTNIYSIIPEIKGESKISFTRSTLFYFNELLDLNQCANLMRELSPVLARGRIDVQLRIQATRTVL